jgi:hypothetical protein
VRERGTVETEGGCRGTHVTYGLEGELPDTSALDDDADECGRVASDDGDAALADAYSHTWDALYPYLSDAAAAPERRLQLALEDVRAVDADVVALQEVRTTPTLP